MDYESIILPILNKHKENTTHELIKELCSVKSPWSGNGYVRCERRWYVEEPGSLHMKPYTRLYGGYGTVSLLNAMKADKVEIVKYAGTSKLTVVLHYYFDNPHTKLFIENDCRVDRNPKLFD